MLIVVCWVSVMVLNSRTFILKCWALVLGAGIKRCWVRGEGAGVRKQIVFDHTHIAIGYIYTIQIRRMSLNIILWFCIINVFWSPFYSPRHFCYLLEHLETQNMQWKIA